MGGGSYPQLQTINGPVFGGGVQEVKERAKLKTVRLLVAQLKS